MKKITLLSAVFLFGFISSCGTMMGTDAPVESRSMEKIFQAEGKTKNNIYISVNEWFVKNFTSAESVIEFQDKEAGKILGKYMFSYTEGIYYYDVRQTISVSIKEGIFKISFENPMFRVTGDALNGSGSGSVNFRPLIKEKGVERARLEWSNLSNDLSKYIKTNDTW